MDINSGRYGVIFWQSFEITGTSTKLAPTTQEQTHEQGTMTCAAIATTSMLETQ